MSNSIDSGKLASEKNWLCPTCNWRSPRRWNMDRHIKLKHKGAINPVKATHVLDYGSMTGSNPFYISHTQAPEHSPAFSSKKAQWMTEMEEYMKIYTAFANSADQCKLRTHYFKR